MQTRFLLAGVAALALAAACAEPAGPTTSLFADRQHDGGRGVTAFTQNLYIGADVDVVIGALASPDPADDLPALIAAIQTLGETAYPLRAQAMADAIARARPHMVGLQEVEQLDIDLTPLGLPVVIHQDFLAILLDALAARGLHYTTAVKVENTVARPIPGISLIDYDAILVDADRVVVTSTASGSYVHNIGPVAPGVVLKRGWTLVRGRVQGRPYVFANTHLESGDGPGLAELRAAQAEELANVLPRNATVLLTGDLNDGPGSPMHRVLVGAGFRDSWAELRGGDAGFTCCQEANLGNAASVLKGRFDYVLVRTVNHLQQLEGEVRRFGADPSERITGPAHLIWTSDHAGVSLRLE